MNKYILHALVVAVIFLASCHTGKRATASRSRQPKFIDDIYMDKHNKNHATADGVDRNVKPADKKYASKKGGAKKAESEGDEEMPKSRVTKSEAKELREKYANMLGVSKKEINNYNLYSFIDEWYGTSYHMGGLDKSGIDCSGFTMKLYQAVFAVALAHSSGDMYANSKRIKKGGDIEQGDLVFFKTRGKAISHVGVYLMNDYFVHASTSQGVVISSLKEEYWQKHFVGAAKARKS
jgi:cell wall-associated NlpC family hydrolase